MGVTQFRKKWKITCENGMEVYYVWEGTDGISKCWCALQKEKKRRGWPKVKCEREGKKSDEAQDSKTWRCRKPANLAKTDLEPVTGVTLENGCRWMDGWMDG